MKLTRKQRRDVYKKAVSRIGDDYSCKLGLCVALLSSVPKNGQKYTLADFPEVNSQRPEEADRTSKWFPSNAEGKSMRIAILAKAIKKTNSWFGWLF